MTRKLRIGVVGGGVYGTQMLKCFASEQAMGRIELAGLADLSPEVLEEGQRKFSIEGYSDYSDMMDRAHLDAVAVATPDHLHAPVINAAIDRGLHVLSQKPLDVDVPRTQALIDRSEKAGVLLYVDFHKRFDPAHIRLRNDIASGALGRLQYGSVHMEDKIVVPTVWLRKWAAESSPSWFLGVHFYDLVYWLTGFHPRRVWASGHKGKLTALGLEDAWDSIQVRVEHQGGFSMNYDLSWILPESFPSIVNQGIRLVGEDGMVEVDSQDRGYLAATSKEAASAVVNPYGALEYAHPVFGTQAEGYTFRSMSYFIDIVGALSQGRTLAELRGTYPDGTAALVSTRLGVAVDRSLATSEVVEV